MAFFCPNGNFWRALLSSKPPLRGRFPPRTTPLQRRIRGASRTAVAAVGRRLNTARALADVAAATSSAGTPRSSARTRATAASSAGSLRAPASQYGGMFALRLALVFLGAGVFGVWLYRTALRPGAETLLGRLAWTAFALVFVSEVLGRFLFYATHVKIGL